LETFLQMPDAAAEQTAVGLELRLARAAQADAALLTFEVSPPSDEPCRQMLELRELDLELAFEARGSLREDVEDQPVAVQHARLERLLQVALLACTQRPVDEDELGIGVGDELCELLHLARPEVVTRVRTVALGMKRTDDLRTGRSGECFELLGFVFVAGPVAADVHEQGSFAAGRTLKQ